ncbi:MAG: hypothetical protein QM520_00725 [Gammaproteobacteria bacterium]|nr:hypothetical protein [Gammaproteobacteria bacterium]
MISLRIHDEVLNFDITPWQSLFPRWVKAGLFLHPQNFTVPPGLLIRGNKP